MLMIQDSAQLRALIRQWRSAGERVAFVPTMGNLHQGHLQLVDTAKQRADRVIVSIFVNPMQFGANEDLDKYPRTLEQDCKGLSEHGADAVFTPTPQLIYPRGLDVQTFVEVPLLGDYHCGASRAGQGVGGHGHQQHGKDQRRQAVVVLGARAGGHTVQRALQPLKFGRKNDECVASLRQGNQFPHAAPRQQSVSVPGAGHCGAEEGRSDPALAQLGAGLLILLLAVAWVRALRRSRN